MSPTNAKQIFFNYFQVSFSNLYSALIYNTIIFIASRLPMIVFYNYIIVKIPDSTTDFLKEQMALNFPVKSL